MKSIKNKGKKFTKVQLGVTPNWTFGTICNNPIFRRDFYEIKNNYKDLKKTKLNNNNKRKVILKILKDRMDKDKSKLLDDFSLLERV